LGGLKTSENQGVSQLDFARSNPTHYIIVTQLTLWCRHSFGFTVGRKDRLTAVFSFKGFNIIALLYPKKTQGINTRANR